MNQPPITFIDVQGIRTAHAVAAPKASTSLSPVLMLHGWGANISLMWAAAERLAPLGYNVYVTDMPGFGQSAPPPQAWSVIDYAKFVIAYLDANQLSAVHLVGHSFGGRVGLVVGAEYPQRIRKMALADSAGVLPRRSESASMRLNLYKGVRDTLYSVGAKGVADGLRGWYNKRYGSADFQAAQGVMRETFVKVVNEDLLPYAARIKASTLLFWGEKDEDTPLWMGQTLEKTIPDAGLITFPGAGHYSYLEHLGEFIRVVDHFFKT